MALRWRGETERTLIIEKKKVIFIFFVYKKYSRRIIKFRLNQWWQMDYADDAFNTFLCLDSENDLAVNGTVSKLS